MGYDSHAGFADEDHSGPLYETDGEAGVRDVAHGFTRGETCASDVGARFSARKKGVRAPLGEPVSRGGAESAEVVFLRVFRVSA